MKHKVKRGQIWIDKKNSNKMLIQSKNHDIIWNCLMLGSGIIHKMTERVINKYWFLYEEKTISLRSKGTHMESL